MRIKTITVIIILLVVFMNPATLAQNYIYLPVIFKDHDGNPSFSGFEGGTLTGPENWETFDRVSPDRLQISTNARYGEYSARFELRPGDIPVGISERVELSRHLDANGNHVFEHSGIKYYSISILMDEGWQPTINSWGVILLQLHGPNELHASPSFSLRAKDNFFVHINGGDLSDPEQSHTREYQFSYGELMPGQWVDFIFRIKYAYDFSGTVDVWRRNEGEEVFTNVLSIDDIPTLHYNSEIETRHNMHYWRCGIYRAWGHNFISVLWLDGFKRGDTFEEVALETSYLLNSSFGDKGEIKKPPGGGGLLLVTLFFFLGATP